jgi:hypothetical protein
MRDKVVERKGRAEQVIEIGGRGVVKRLMIDCWRHMGKSHLRLGSITSAILLKLRRSCQCG